MLIKTAPFVPIQITIETEDDFHEISAILNHVKQNCPNSHLRQTASGMLDHIESIYEAAEVYRHE